MTIRAGRYWIVFNGEIYNYREIRDELRSRGVTISSDSDTEVILQAYAHWGCDAIQRLRGMFAFCILDLEKRTFLLARDHFGIKPFYFAMAEGALGFASEPGALITLMQLPSRLNTSKAIEYLAQGSDENDTQTFFQGISKLGPGTYAVGNLSRPDDITVTRYWDAGMLPPMDPHLSAPSRLRELFLESVDLHLRADVPVGILLSGGVDSSAIACAARTIYPKQEIHTFTYSASDASVNETAYANEINQHIGAVAHPIEVESLSFRAHAEEVIEELGEPVRGMSVLAQSAVFQGVKRSGLKVVLSGQGADELLAGYLPYQARGLVDSVNRGALGASIQRCLNLRREDQLSTVLGLAAKEGIGVWFPDILARILVRQLQDTLVPAATRHALAAISTVAKSRGGDLRNRLRLDVGGNQLLGQLRYEDRMSMACSIESRVPFLLPEFARAVQAASSQDLVDDKAVTKAVFREAMTGIVPEAVLKRRSKFGYTGPEVEWANSIAAGILSEIDQVLDRKPRFLRSETLFNWRRAGKCTLRNPRVLWSFYNLFVWMRKFDVTMDMADETRS